MKDDDDCMMMVLKVHSILTKMEMYVDLLSSSLSVLHNDIVLPSFFITILHAYVRSVLSSIVRALKFGKFRMHIQHLKLSLYS
jgi:hypothetical protein